MVLPLRVKLQRWALCCYSQKQKCLRMPNRVMSWPSLLQAGGWLLAQIIPMGKRDAFREMQALGKQRASSTLWAGARAAGDGVAQFAGYVLFRGDSQVAQKCLLFHFFWPSTSLPKAE